MAESSYKRFTDYSVEMQSLSEPDMRVVRGRGILNQHEQRFTFIEATPRGKRSVEVGRTSHCRFVRRPDGLYTATFRFNAGEKYLVPALLAEVRSICKQAQADREIQQRIAAEEGKEGGDV